MKRSIIIVLALLLLALEAFAFAGCGGKEGNAPGESIQPQEGGIIAGGDATTGDSDEGDSMDGDSTEGDIGSMVGDSGSPLAWPVAELPPGLPEYPDGTIEDISVEDRGVFLYILNTEKGSVDSYVESLVDSGWVYDDSEPELTTLSKGGWLVVILFEDDAGLAIAATDAGNDGKSADELN